MTNLTSCDQLREALARPTPQARLEGFFEAAPNLVCWARSQRLGEVLAMARASLGWSDGRLTFNQAAWAERRLRDGLLADGGQPLFAGPREPWLKHLPAGTVDRLLAALDQVSGYPNAFEPAAELVPATADAAEDRLAAYLAGGEWVPGLLPAAPEATLRVGAYDFGALCAADAEARVCVAGEETRCEPLAWPRLLAASLRCGPEGGAPPLLNAALALELPYGAARALVERADAWSEMGRPLSGYTFLLEWPEPLDADSAGARA